MREGDQVALGARYFLEFWSFDMVQVAKTLRGEGTRWPWMKLSYWFKNHRYLGMFVVWCPAPGS